MNYTIIVANEGLNVYPFYYQIVTDVTIEPDDAKIKIYRRSKEGNKYYEMDHILPLHFSMLRDDACQTVIESDEMCFIKIISNPSLYQRFAMFMRSFWC